eukprot:bmy_02589T0
MRAPPRRNCISQKSSFRSGGTCGLWNSCHRTACRRRTWLSRPDRWVACWGQSVGQRRSWVAGGSSPGPGWGSPTPGDSPPCSRPGARRAGTSISRATSSARTSMVGSGA